ncbi:hypothetical protein HDU97_009056, partial [Phlyctochytrium planicorne]
MSVGLQFQFRGRTMIAQPEPILPDTFVEFPGSFIVEPGNQTSVFHDDKCARMSLGTCYDLNLDRTKQLCAIREGCGGFVCWSDPNDGGCFLFGKEKITLGESGRLKNGLYGQNGWLKPGVTAMVRGRTITAQPEPILPDNFIEVPGTYASQLGLGTSVFFDDKCTQLSLGTCYDLRLDRTKQLCAARQGCGGFVCWADPKYGGCFLLGTNPITLEESAKFDNGKYEQNGWLKPGVTAKVRGTNTVAGVRSTTSTAATIPPAITTAAPTNTDSPVSSDSTATPKPTPTSTSTSAEEQTQTPNPGRPDGPHASEYLFEYPGYGILSGVSTKFQDPSCKGSCSTTGRDRLMLADKICKEKDGCAGYTCTDNICDMFGWERIEMTQSFNFMNGLSNVPIFNSWIKDGATVLIYNRTDPTSVTNRTLIIDNPLVAPKASTFVSFKGNSAVQFGEKTEIFWSWTDCKIRDVVSGTCLTKGENAESEAKAICDKRFRCGGYVCKVVVGSDNPVPAPTIPTDKVTTTLEISNFEYIPGISVWGFGSQTSIFSDPDCKETALGTCVMRDVAAARTFCGFRPACAGFVCDRSTLPGCYLIGIGSISLLTSQSDSKGFLQNGWIKPGTTITLTKVVTLSPQPTLPPVAPLNVTRIVETVNSDPSSGAVVTQTSKAAGTPAFVSPTQKAAGTPGDGVTGGGTAGRGESDIGGGGGGAGLNMKLVVIGVACGVFAVVVIALVGISQYVLKHVRRKAAAAEEVVPGYNEGGVDEE